MLQVDFLVFERDEGVRKWLQEGPLRDCFARFVADEQAARKQLSQCDLKFFDSFIVGDPLWSNGRPTEDWTFLGKLLDYKASGKKIISFSVDTESMERAVWADYNILKPGLDELAEAVAAVRKEVETFRLQEKLRMDEEQKTALNEIIVGELLSRPGRSVEELFPVVSRKFDKVMSDNKGAIMLYPDSALKFAIRQVKAGLLY